MEAVHTRVVEPKGPLFSPKNLGEDSLGSRSSPIFIELSGKPWPQLFGNQRPKKTPQWDLE